MRPIVPVLVGAAIAAAATWAAIDACQSRTTTVLLVRHADREPGRDQLSAAGLERARKLTEALRDADLAAIYQTQYRRTQQTAAAVATAFGLTPVAVDARDSEALARDVLQNHRGETVLVVGHSNTVPDVVAALGGPSIPDFAEDDYGKLLVLDLCGCIRKWASLTELRY